MLNFRDRSLRMLNRHTVASSCCNTSTIVIVLRHAPVILWDVRYNDARDDLPFPPSNKKKSDPVCHSSKIYIRNN